MRHPAEGGRSRQILLRVLTGAATACVVLVVTLAGTGGQQAPDQAAPAPALAPGAGAPLGFSEPVEIEIPAVGVVSELVDLGLRADGTMQVPDGAFPAGWYTGAPTPGELGPAVIAGHVNWAGERGVFARLHEIAPGDRVVVRRSDGTSALFQAERVAEYPKDRFPAAEVYGNIDHAGLRLITCGGEFDPATGHYDDNIVVYATLVGPA